ncbi:hypothetical protein ACHAW5_008528 [Stephanodiscus triporus]|uniref:Uncharacterized protein n=1 Tax=Stephanodiscus triporus TaxID=2934178 RepID=A0ABD3Q1D1_9STRA
MAEGHLTPKRIDEEHNNMSLLPECPPPPRMNPKALLALDWNSPSSPTPSPSRSFDHDDDHDDDDAPSDERRLHSGARSIKRGYYHDGVLTTSELRLKPRPYARPLLFPHHPHVGDALRDRRSTSSSSSTGRIRRHRIGSRNKKPKMTKSPSFNRAA